MSDTLKYPQTVNVPLRGRRTRKSQKNSLQFFARVEGYPDRDLPQGCIRGANGMKWRLP